MGPPSVAGVPDSTRVVLEVVSAPLPMIEVMVGDGEWCKIKIGMDATVRYSTPGTIYGTRRLMEGDALAGSQPPYHRPDAARPFLSPSST